MVIPANFDITIGRSIYSQLETIHSIEYLALDPWQVRNHL